MTQIHETGSPVHSYDNHARLEEAIAAWKANVSDAHASLTSRLIQTHELLDCLVKAFAERQDRTNGATSAWAEVEQIRATLTERETALATAQAEIETLRAAVAAAQGEIETFRAALAGQDEARTEALAEAERLRATLTERETALATAQAETDSLRTTLEDRDRDLGASRSEIEGLRVELTAQRQTFDAQSVGQIEALQAELAAMRDREAEAIATARRLGEEIASPHDEVVSLSSALDAARQQVETLRGELEAARASVESEHRTQEAATQQQAQWKNELAQDLAVEARRRRVLEDECEELRAETAMLQRANESLSKELSVTRVGGKSTYPFRLFDAAGRKYRLGEMLVDAGYLTPPQLDDALHEQESMRETRLGTILVDKGFVAEDVVNQGIAVQLQAAS